MVRIFVDEGETAELFYVYNTNDRKLMVLAQNRPNAVKLAKAYGHVKDVSNARVVSISSASKDDKFMASVRGAIRDGRQGIVRNLDGFAVVGEGSQAKTYAPIMGVNDQ